MLSAFKKSPLPTGDKPTGDKQSLNGVTIDSRQNTNNKVFFALKGKNFDGHDYLNQAIQKGAKMIVVSNPEKTLQALKSIPALRISKKTWPILKALPLKTPINISLKKPTEEKQTGENQTGEKQTEKKHTTNKHTKDKQNVSILLVPNTLKALKDLAQAWRQHLNIKPLAVTGSNGKTSTKAFAQTLLSGVKAFASPKSYNNRIGLSLSLLAVDRREAFLVQEIGTSAPGEIAPLTKLCRPVVSAVTMVGPSHLLALKSLSNIAKEKQEIYLNSPTATWIFNQDNPWTYKMFQKLKSKNPSVLSFSSLNKKADVSLCFSQHKKQTALVKGHIGGKSSQAWLCFSGQPYLQNLMCASAMALGAGISPQEIWQKLPLCTLPKGRQQLIKHNKISIFFDAYNANPSSMSFFIQTCETLAPGAKRLFVLGDMKELGPKANFYHKQLAQKKALIKSRFIAFVGDFGELVEADLKQQGFKGGFVRSKHYNKRLLSVIKKELKAGDVLALKASRSLMLEQLVFDLKGDKKSLF